jgi:hypothetical protein
MACPTCGDASVASALLELRGMIVSVITKVADLQQAVQDIQDAANSSSSSSGQKGSVGSRHTPKFFCPLGCKSTGFIKVPLSWVLLR